MTDEEPGRFDGAREPVRAVRSAPAVKDPLLESARVEFARTLRELTPQAFVTPTIIALNIGVFVVMIAAGVHPVSPTTGSLVQWGADFGPLTTNGQWWRLATSMFLHIGVIHILCNMIGLWGIGPLVERLLGNWGYLIVYVAAGFLGSLASTVWNPYVVSAGASGAIFGLYGALLGFLVREKGSIPGVVLARLKSSGLTFLGYNLVYGLARQGVDMAAHLGGLGGGFLCGLMLSRPLTRDAIEARPRSNLALGALGATMIAAAIASLPHAVDFEAELHRFEETEKAKIAIYNGAVDRMNSGKIGEKEFAGVIETEILPDWSVMRKRIDALRGLPDRVATVVESVDRYAAARERSWRLIAEGYREHDESKLREAKSELDKIRARSKQVSGD